MILKEITITINKCMRTRVENPRLPQNPTLARGTHTSQLLRELVGAMRMV